MFLILFLMFFFSLMTYLYSNYSNWVLWMVLVLFFYLVMFCGGGFNRLIRDKIGTSNSGVILIIFCYVVFLIWIASNAYSILIGMKPHQASIEELTHASQIAFFFTVLFTHSISSIFYFGGTLIKRTLFPEKPEIKEEVILVKICQREIKRKMFHYLQTAFTASILM